MSDKKDTNQGIQICPHCAEMIKVEALVCRYCNRDIKSYKEKVKENWDTKRGTKFQDKAISTSYGIILMVSFFGGLFLLGPFGAIIGVGVFLIYQNFIDKSETITKGSYADRGQFEKDE
tara:strand:+ start:690 stop:1046 length:357 start_codon:yes stop_codon:yes gene_type:complete